MRLDDEIYIETEGLDQDENLKYFYRDLLWKACTVYFFENWQAGREEFGFDEGCIPVLQVSV